MNRNYSDSVEKDIIFFVGNEVEHTPAYGMKTLFVTGIQTPHEIQKHYTDNNCEHIFFGANHSFNPDTDEDWIHKNIITRTMFKLLETGLQEYDNFIPQLRVPIPYVRQWNYNTMIKIDDKGFKQTNPGVWSHSLHELMDKKKFTDWTNYGLDKIIR